MQAISSHESGAEYKDPFLTGFSSTSSGALWVTGRFKYGGHTSTS